MNQHLFTAEGGPGDGRDVSRYVRTTIREVAEHRLVGDAPADAHLRHPDGGQVRAGALAAMMDTVGGLCGGLAALPEGWIVSTNLVARLAGRADHAGPLRVDATVLRRGRNAVITAVQVADAGADGALLADGVLTSAVLVPDNGPPQWERPLVLEAGPALDPPPPPITEWLGLRTPDASTVEIDVVPALRNPWGILHGGVVAMLADLAAEHATGARTRDLVLHFLAPNRTGPIRATARPLGTQEYEHVTRVELRDEGADRVAAVAIVTTA